MEQPNLPESTPSTPTVLPTSPLAIVSLISGIVGILFLPLLGGIVAIVTGNMARKETRSFPATHSGDGMATAGMVLGWLGVILWFTICCVIVMGFVLSAGSAWWTINQ